MTIVQIKNPMGKDCGFYIIEEKIYKKIIDYKKHVFHVKKYDNMVAISISILIQLNKGGCKTFEFTLQNFEKEDVIIFTNIDYFLANGKEIYFKGAKNADRQFGLPLRLWTRKSSNQKEIVIQNLR